MEIQLSIRHNLPAEGDPLGSARVETFADEHALSVGTAESCDCRIGDSESFAPRHFELIPPRGGGREWTLRLPSSHAELFVNGKKALGGEAISSGDEIRVGHWTLQFHRNPRRGEFHFRRDWAATVNRVLVAALLLGELAVIVWLPQHLQSSSLWETGRLRQGSALAIDTLREDLKQRQDSADPTAAAAYRLLARDVGRLARFLQEHGQSLDREQWEEVRRRVENSRRIKERIDRGQVFHPLPEIKRETAVQALLSPAPEIPSPSRKGNAP